MEIVTQLNITRENAPGNLAKVSDKLRASGVNISAVSCTEGPKTSTLHLIVDDVDSAKLILQPICKLGSTEILAFQMRNKPGAIAAIGRACAGAGINIKNIYATTNGHDKEAIIYIAVDNAPEAVEMLKPWRETLK